MVDRAGILKDPLKSGSSRRQAEGGFAAIIITLSEFEKEFY